MMASIRLALMNVRLVMRTKVALFFTFLFPLVFLFVYAGLFAHGDPQAVAYLFGPVITLNIMGSGFWGLGLQAVVQRERGSLRRFRLAPIGSGTIVASNLLANYLLQLPTLALLVICARVFFDMPLKVGLLEFLTLATVGVFAFAGFGLIIASVANTMQEAQIYNNLAWITLLFLSGTTIPLPMLPKWIQTVAAFLPATYLVSAFQAVMIQSQPLYQHWPEMLALVVSGAFGLLFAWKLFRWEKEERISRRQKWWTLGFVAPFLLVGTWMNAYANPRASWSTAYTLMQGLESAGTTPPSSVAKGVVIEDFEESKAEEDLLKRWQVTTTESSVTEFTLSSPGADGSSKAMTLAGRFVPPLRQNAQVIARYQFTPPPEAKRSHGLELRVRGDLPICEINLYPQDAPPAIHAGIRMVPSNGWQTARIPVIWVTKSEKPKPAPPPWILEIVVPGQKDEFSLEVDEIRLY
jgi:ABC-2 type transport system permease protein